MDDSAAWRACTKICLGLKLPGACKAQIVLRVYVPGSGVVVDEVEVLPSDPPQRPTSVPQALQQNMPLASVSRCFTSAAVVQLTATDRLLLWPCMVPYDAVLCCSAIVQESPHAWHAVFLISCCLCIQTWGGHVL